MPEENDAPPAGKKKLIIIAAAVITLLIAGAVVFFLFMGDDQADAQDVAAEDGKEVAAEVEKMTAHYVPMPRPLVFNVLEGKRDRTVQIKVQLMVGDKSSAALARKHIPLLESTLVRVFGGATAEQLRSPEGKIALRATTLEELNKATMQVENRALIHKVLFTGFVLQ